jgi:hypothetical protein
MARPKPDPGRPAGLGGWVLCNACQYGTNAPCNCVKVKGRLPAPERLLEVLEVQV